MSNPLDIYPMGHESKTENTCPVQKRLFSICQYSSKHTLHTHAHAHAHAHAHFQPSITVALCRAPGTEFMRSQGQALQRVFFMVRWKREYKKENKETSGLALCRDQQKKDDLKGLTGETKEGLMKGDSRPAVIKVRPLSRPVKKCAHIHTHTHTLV